MRTAAGYLGSIPTQHVTIDFDRECAACCYNLRGLQVGARCPECGAGIAPAGDGDDPLSRMPMRIIRIFRRAAWLATLCIFLAAGSVWSVMFGTLAQGRSQTLIALFTVLWIAAMWMLTPVVAVREAAVRGFSQRGIARRIARWGQFGWLVLIVALLVEGQLRAGPPTARPIQPVVGLMQVLQLAGLVCGGIAMIAMAVLMERLAEWARDDTAARLFQFFQWLLPLALLIALVMGMVPLVGLIFQGLVLIAALLFPLAMIILTGSITLSAVHQREHQDRERRRADRKHEDARRLDERLRKVEG